MFTRKFSIILSILGVVVMGGIFLFFASCERRDISKKAPMQKAVSSEGETVIGLSMGTLREDRWIRDAEMFIEKAKELGAAVNVLFANNDSQLQISQLQNLILQGVDVLVVVPQDAEGAAVIVEKAHKEGIKVVAYDRLIRNCDLDFYISFDSVKVGELEAKGVLGVVDKGKFAYIGGSEKDNNAFLLKEGTMRLLEPRIQSGDISLVVDKFTPDWKPEEAYKTMRDYLKANKTIDAVVAANDGTAFGVIQALKEYGLAGKVPVSGQDAELGACQRVVEGIQTVTVYKPLRLLAHRAAEIAVALAKGEEAESNGKINNGQIDVSAYLIEPITVNKDNMMEVIIKDGFYTYEEVYKTAPRE